MRGCIGRCARAWRSGVVCLAGALAAAAALADEDREQPFRIPRTAIVLKAAAPSSNADPANPDGPEDVITQRNNNLRTGTTLRRGMNQAFVSDGRFGWLGALPVDGHVLAQPLYMAAVDFPGGRRAAVFVATSTNWLYAFDADTLQLIWSRNLGPPLRLDDAFSDFNLGNCSVQMVRTEQDARAGRNSMVMGIEATPAIEPHANRMIVSYRSGGGPTGGMPRITAIDIRTGQTMTGPSGIPLDRQLTDNPHWNKLHRNRTSLLIEDGLVFVAFSARCEGNQNGFDKSYQGWIYAFDTRTLAFAGRYRTTQSPNGAPPQEPSDDPVQGGGIWQASTGLASDGHGNLFFGTGNARGQPLPPDAGGKNLSSSVIRVGTMRQSGSGTQPTRVTMTADDWFTPYRKVWQDAIDLDLGSAGVVLIPNTPYLAAGGKEGILYVLNRNDLGKFDDRPPFKTDAVINQTTATAHDEPERDRVVQKLPAGINQYCAARTKSLYCFRDTPKGEPKLDPNVHQDGVTMSDWIGWPHIHGTPVFGAFADGRAFLYVWPEKDHLKSYSWEGKRFDPKPEVATVLPDHRLAALAPPYLQDHIGSVGMPGGLLSLVIDPAQPAAGVLFASVQRCRANADDPVRHECTFQLCDDPERCREQNYGQLRAFDPIALRELWNNQRDGMAPEAQKDYWFAKFVPPTIGGGRVFLATGSGKVMVYGRPGVGTAGAAGTRSARAVLVEMRAANLRNSVGDATLLEWVAEDNAYYRKLSEASLALIGTRRLVGDGADIDKVNFFYLRQLGLRDEAQLPADHVIDRRALERALLLAHRDKTGVQARSFNDIVR